LAIIGDDIFGIHTPLTLYLVKKITEERREKEESVLNLYLILTIEAHVESPMLLTPTVPGHRSLFLTSIHGGSVGRVVGDNDDIFNSRQIPYFRPMPRQIGP
jgi:hypothetical protein